MKRLFPIIALATLVFSSCNNKVDLYSDEGDSTIVYALLDSEADTNFVKITKSFIGNANELAQNYEANNYKYGEIEATITGVFEGSNSTKEVHLDTISKWIPYNENSAFYSGCRQTYYYFTERLKEGQEYNLEITRNTDGVKITAKAKTINTFRFKKPFDNTTLNFSGKKGSIEWRVTDASTLFHTTAAYFEVNGFFNYKELMPGATDTVHQVIRWSIGEGEAESMFTTQNNDSYYVQSYTPMALYTLLETNDYLKNNSPAGVQRWFENFEFSITAIGDELYRYNIVNNSSSAIQDVQNYSNINNGIGLMSSRITKIVSVKIDQVTRKNIQDNYLYGFIYDPNR